MAPSRKWGPYLNKHRIGTRYKQIDRETGKLITEIDTICDKKIEVDSRPEGQVNESLS
jgi:hypothetical protein